MRKKDIGPMSRQVEKPLTEEEFHRELENSRLWNEIEEIADEALERMKGGRK